jgi:hypothetical protein
MEIMIQLFLTLVVACIGISFVAYMLIEGKKISDGMSEEEKAAFRARHHLDKLD